MDFHFQRIIPQSALLQEVEIFELYQLTSEFHQEVKYREEFQEYCQWYREISQQHQAELAQLQNDINLFGWFCQKIF